jgi:molybdopterin/thiamine biosynthesis adenylyltransferase
MSQDLRFRAIDAGFDRAALDSKLDQVLRVVIDAEQAGWAAQLLAICLVDLLARLSPRIVLDCDPELRAHRALPPGPDLLLDRLERARSHSLTEPLETAGEPTITVVVGNADPVEADLYVDGSGWIAYLGTSPPGQLAADDGNPVGPLAAACRGAAATVQLLLGDLLHGSTIPAASYWSAATLTSAAPADAAAGPVLQGARIDALLMGAGSIGGAAAYTLARVPGLEGTLALVDFDALEQRNSRKALLARRVDIEDAALKIDVAAAELAHHPDLDTPQLQGTLAKWVAERPATDPLPLVLCAVDSIDARRELADHMPLDVVNAACGEHDLRVSGHRTDDGPCVYCLYLPDLLDAELTRKRMIVRETGFEPRYVAQLRVNKVKLGSQHLRQIEDQRDMDRGSLPRSPRMTLDELFDRHLLYGEAQFEDTQGRRGVLTLPFVPGLAGVLLAAEALKRSLDPPRLDLALGPKGPATEYSEDLFDWPGGLCARYPRVEGSACLCRSKRRLALMHERYQLPL